MILRATPILMTAAIISLVSCKSGQSTLSQTEVTQSSSPVVLESLSELSYMATSDDRLLFADGTLIAVKDLKANFESHVEIGFRWTLAPQLEIQLKNPRVPLLGIFLKSVADPVQ